MLFRGLKHAARGLQNAPQFNLGRYKILFVIIEYGPVYC